MGDHTETTEIDYDPSVISYDQVPVAGGYDNPEWRMNLLERRRVALAICSRALNYAAAGSRRLLVAARRHA